MWQAAVCGLCVLAVVSALPSQQYYDEPAYEQPAYGAPPHSDYKEPEHAPARYEYKYGVLDDYQGTDFSASESRDGEKTYGEYRVVLPDSRIQTVRYVDNGYGLEAEVTYEGEAIFPEEYEPKYQHKQPKYPAHAPPQYKEPSYPQEPLYVYRRR